MGLKDDAHASDKERAALVAELVKAGHADRICCRATQSVSRRASRTTDLPYSYILTTFVPLLKEQGLSDEDVQRILVDNPRDLLSVR